MKDKIRVLVESKDGEISLEYGENMLAVLDDEFVERIRINGELWDVVEKNISLTTNFDPKVIFIVEKADSEEE